MLRILARKYELKDSEDRAPLTDVINASFPSLLQLVKVGLATNLVGPCWAGGYLLASPRAYSCVAAAIDCNGLGISGGGRAAEAGVQDFLVCNVHEHPGDPAAAGAIRGLDDMPAYTTGQACTSGM